MPLFAKLNHKLELNYLQALDIHTRYIDIIAEDGASNGGNHARNNNIDRYSALVLLCPFL